MTVEFDGFAETYRAEVDQAIAFAGQGVDFYARRKAALTADIVRQNLGDPRNLAILDVGCGIGLLDGPLSERFGTVAGVDVSPAEVAVAQRTNPTVDYAVSEPASIPHATARFDVSFAACVFHHVPNADRLALLAEMTRVTKPGGAVIVFEHNPLNPLTRLVVRRVAFDRDAQLLGPRQLRSLFEQARLTRTELRYTTFVPWDGSTTRRVERALRRLPVGAQYVLAGTTAP